MAERWLTATPGASSVMEIVVGIGLGEPSNAVLQFRAVSVRHYSVNSIASVNVEKAGPTIGGSLSPEISWGSIFSGCGQARPDVLLVQWLTRLSSGPYGAAFSSTDAHHQHVSRQPYFPRSITPLARWTSTCRGSDRVDEARHPLRWGSAISVSPICPRGRHTPSSGQEIGRSSRRRLGSRTVPEPARLQ
jgi:hypothetical protein